MAGHIRQSAGQVSSRYNKALDPRRFQPQSGLGGGFGTPFVPSDLLDNFRFDFNNPSPEFDDRGKRLRPASFDELRERQGQNLFQNFGAIARGTEGTQLIRDPVTGQPSRKYVQGTNGRRGYWTTRETIPSFNIEGTKVDLSGVDFSGAQRANSQRFSAQRQAAARGAIGTFGNRLGARSGAAGLAAINQSAAPLFAAQTTANAGLQQSKINLQAGAAFTDHASEQAATLQNLQTRKFGVQGQERMLNAFRSEAGQRANIEIGRGGLELRREDSIIGKEAGDANRTLESQRIDIMGWDAWARDERARFSNFLQQLRDEFEREKEANKGGFSVGDIFKIGARAFAAYFTGGVSEVAYQGGNAASGGFDAPLFGGK